MKQFFQLKSGFYFLKNIVFAIFCFLLGYLLGSGIIKAEASSFEEIKALDLTNIYDEFKAFNYEIWDTKKGTKVSYKMELDRLITNLDNLNVNYMIAYSDFNTRKYLQDHNSASQFYFTIYIFNSNNVTLVNESNNGLFYFEKEHNQIQTYTSRYAYFIEKDLKVLSDYIEQNQSLPTQNLLWEESPYSGGIYKSTTPFAPTFLSNDNVGTFVYRSNVNLKFESTQYDIMKVGSNVYNSQVPVYDQIKNYGKTIYTFNETVSASNSQIRFKFDIPTNQAFTFDFNHSVTYSRSYMNSAPHLAYTEVDSRLITHNYKLPLDSRFDSEEQVIYSDTQINNFSADTTSLEFVVELNNRTDEEGTVHIFFESEYPFTYEYEADDYYATVDFSNKYGVLLIPKVYNMENFEETEVYSTVYVHGYNLFLRTYASTDLSQTPLQEFNNLGHKDNNVFYHYNYLFRADKKEQTLFILDKEYLIPNRTSLVKYDTRYFVHSICSTIDSCDPILNPNTNKEINIKPPTIGSDDGEELDTIDKIYDSMDQFINSAKEKSDYFNQLFDNFFKNMPDWIQALCVFVFIMLQVFVILKIGGFGHGSD